MSIVIQALIIDGTMTFDKCICGSGAAQIVALTDPDGNDVLLGCNGRHDYFRFVDLFLQSFRKDMGV